MFFQAQVPKFKLAQKLDFFEPQCARRSHQTGSGNGPSLFCDHFSNLPPTSSLDGRLLTVTRVSCEGLRCVKPSKGVNKKPWSRFNFCFLLQKNEIYRSSTSQNDAAAKVLKSELHKCNANVSCLRSKAMPTVWTKWSRNKKTLLFKS
jgi:hypothetical protein